MDIFCKIIAGELPSNKVYEDDDLICIMDAHPDAPGHALVIPKKHYTTILDLDEEIWCKIKKVSDMIMKKQEERLPGITGIRVAVNYGEPQVVKHFHMHLIPVYINKPDLSQETICNILKQK